MPITALKRWLRISTLTLYRLVTWTILAAGLAFCAVVLGLRYWVLPNVDQHRESIARAIGHSLGQRVAIGRVSGNWDGLNPELLLEDVTLFDTNGAPALKLSRIEGTLSWFSVAAWEPRFRSVELERPMLDIRRDANGALFVAGIEMKKGEGGGFADWLLRQRRISVRQASLSWHDELRGAPPLRLAQVDFLLRNRGSRHRFGLRAVPPSELAGPLDLRGELFGGSLPSPAQWHGRLFLQVDSVDLDRWSPWLPATLPAPTGAGALRLWAQFREHRFTAAAADVHLAGVRVRLAPELPELELAALSGRIGWKDAPGGMEVSTTALAFSAADGSSIEPTDFYLRVSGGNDLEARGELRANLLALEPLAMLADRLPLDSEFRGHLVALAPKGRLLDLAVRWNGDWRAPVQYVARGRFEGLGAVAVDKFPGFSGITGVFEANEKTGTVRLNSESVTFDMPRVFRAPLDFDSVVAEIGWSNAEDAPHFHFEKVALANAHFAGSLSGNYRVVPDGRGVIDITGGLTRADARHVAHYIPLVIGQPTREWLDTALVSGRSSDVTLRLKGDLDDFPFPDNKGGVFEVVAKVSGGVLDCASGWPQIENIAAEVAFRGKRMEVNAHQGTILGARLLKVRAEIPDVVTHYEVLQVAGEAEGPSKAFLSFIEQSPVLDMIDRFTEGMRVEGPGKLALKLEIPLREREKSKVAGNYEFTGNRLIASLDLPPVEQASGRLEFTESTVRVPGATAVFLGGPIAVSSATQSDAVRINVQGRTDFEKVRERTGNARWMQYVSGAADWRGSLILRKKLVDLVIESDLRGIESGLPAPLAKSAGEERPLRIGRRFISQTQGLTDRIEAAYGEILSARLVRRHGETKDTIRQGTIRFGGAAPEPEREGIWVSGKLKQLDLDRWLALTEQETVTVAVQGELAGIDASVEELLAMNRTFHNVTLSATAQDGGWRGTLSGREFDGAVSWQPQNRGKLTARMKKLAIPAAQPGERREAAADRGRELPAIDIVAEQFQFKDKELGKLELNATPVERNWRIDRLRVSNPDAVLSAEALVRDMVAQPRMRAVVNLQVNDIGKLLTRLGYPEGVRQGTARLEGTLAWPGGPQDFEYGALAGNLKLNAAKGQFIKLEPGIGKLLGILSLQALPRRLTLDFGDIFSRGFAFDEIGGEVGIEHGIASTENFRIQGPAARIGMSGQVDLARETQRLHVRIVPSLSDSVSIAGALIGGPVAGVATILAQKILRDPLSQMFAYEYDVAGTWAEPQVSKIDRLPPAATEAN